MPVSEICFIKDFVPDHDGLIVVDAFLILLQATAILAPDPLLQGPDRAWKFDC